MNFMRLLHEALANIFVAKLRSLLTLLGVLIGTASVVALVSSGQLATQHALAQFKDLGTNLLAVSINPTTTSSSDQSTKLTVDKVASIQTGSPDILEIAPYTTYYAPVSYAGTQIEANIIGATDALQDIIKIRIARGRFVSYLDKNAFYCVIGNEVANKMIAAGAIDPLGKQIRVGNYIYTIIGITQPWPENIFMYADIGQSLIIPIQNSFLLSKYVQIQNIIFKLKPEANIDRIQNQITQKVNQLLPNQQLFFRSPAQLIASMEKQRQTLTLFLTFIGGISLLVGGIGVMNIMLVSVVERRREIGIRMAIGATRKDIGLMFITEAVTLTLCGGVLGILIGEIISFVVAELSGWGFQIFFGPPVIGFLVSAAVGIFFGFYPSYKASQLNPIETLRSE